MRANRCNTGFGDRTPGRLRHGGEGVHTDGSDHFCPGRRVFRGISIGPDRDDAHGTDDATVYSTDAAFENELPADLVEACVAPEAPFEQPADPILAPAG
jgi:hypothetical protein